MVSRYCSLHLEQLLFVTGVNFFFPQPQLCNRFQRLRSISSASRITNLWVNQKITIYDTPFADLSPVVSIYIRWRNGTRETWPNGGRGVMGRRETKGRVSHFPLSHYPSRSPWQNVSLKVTRSSYFVRVSSYFDALWYPHLYFDRKFNI